MHHTQDIDTTLNHAIAYERELEFFWSPSLEDALAVDAEVMDQQVRISNTLCAQAYEHQMMERCT